MALCAVKLTFGQLNYFVIKFAYSEFRNKNRADKGFYAVICSV